MISIVFRFTLQSLAFYKRRDVYFFAKSGNELHKYTFQLFILSPGLYNLCMTHSPGGTGENSLYNSPHKVTAPRCFKSLNRPGWRGNWCVNACNTISM
jgi:hypothetical protein